MAIRLRRATEQDADLLFEWVNDPEVRNNSFSTRPISYREHLEWYKRLMSDENSAQYILEEGTEAVGQARLTICGNRAEIGYSICRAKRCKGYGREMLRLLARKVQEEYPAVDTLIARVKPHNTASQQALLNAGYEERSREFEMDLRNMFSAENERQAKPAD